VALQPNGKILVAAAGIVLRYLPDGKLDPTFGDVGFATPSHGHRLRASAEIEPREFRHKWAQGVSKGRQGTPGYTPVATVAVPK